MAKYIRIRNIAAVVIGLLLVPTIGVGDDSSSSSSQSQQGRSRQTSNDTSDSQHTTGRQRNDSRNTSQSYDRDQSDRGGQSNGNNSATASSSSEQQRLLRAFHGYYTGFESGYQQSADDHTLVFELSPSADDQSNDLGLERRIKLTGDVVRTRSISIPQSDTKHLIALIKTDDDQCLVDLGPTDDVKKLDLGKGDEVTVRGIRARVADHTIIFAEQIKANDKSVSVPFEEAKKSDEQSGAASIRQQARLNLNRTLDQIQEQSQNSQARHESKSDQSQR